MEPRSSNSVRFLISLILLAGLTPILMVGCTEETVISPPETPESGTRIDFSGRIVSYPSGSSVGGAAYTFHSTDYSGEADSLGFFGILNLPVGSYLVRISAPGHTSSIVALEVTQVQAMKSNGHVHRDLFLIENSGTVELTVGGELQTEPLAGVPVMVGFISFPEGAADHIADYRIPPGGYFTDESGVLVLVDFPASTVQLVVGPATASEEGLQYAPETMTCQVIPSISTPVSTILQVDIGEPPSVVRTNLPETVDSLIADDHIFVTFSEPMDTNPVATSAALAFYSGGTQIPLRLEWVSDIRLEIRPLIHLQSATDRYDINIFVKSRQNELVVLKRTRLHWYWSIGNEPTPCEDSVESLTTAPNNAPIDANTAKVDLQWPALPCAEGYIVYARDDHNVSEWTNIAIVDDDYSSGMILAPVRLPAQFDRYTSDQRQDPFAGTNVEFCVVPRNSLAEHRFDSAPKLVLKDETPPRVINIQQTGTGYAWYSEEPLTMTFKFVFSEFIGEDVADPVFFANENGTSQPSNTLLPEAAVWQWEEGRKTGRFTVPLPSHGIALGDEVTAVFEDLEDRSGNEVPENWEAGSHVVTEIGYLDDMEGVTYSWITSGEVWSVGIPTGNVQAHSGSSCFGISFSRSWIGGATGTLNSPEFEVPEEAPYVSFWYYKALGYSEKIYIILVTSGGNVNLAIIDRYGATNRWTQYDILLDSYAGQKVRLAFKYESTTDYEGTFFFIDDVLMDSSRLE